MEINLAEKRGNAGTVEEVAWSKLSCGCFLHLVSSKDDAVICPVIFSLVSSAWWPSYKPIYLPLSSLSRQSAWVSQEIQKKDGPRLGLNVVTVSPMGACRLQ
ncbi:hypothetical protein CLAIMM_08904 [Cladophialophora immunda]|nr:hypothetical protein CLAIMM_08904 [Cladophialophora immunda]